MCSVISDFLTCITVKAHDSSWCPFLYYATSIVLQSQQVEQLMILPVAVLKGIMVKYEKDEEKEVRLLKAKYV